MLDSQCFSDVLAIKAKFYDNFLTANLINLKKFFTDSSLFVLQAILQKAIAFLTVSIYTRVFTTAEYGTITLITNSVLLLSLGLNLGLDSALVAYFCEAETIEQKRLASSTVLLIRIVIYTLAAGLIIIFVQPISNILFHQDQIKLLILAVANFLVLAIISHCNELLRFLTENRLRFTLGTISFISSTILSLIFIIFTSWGIAGIYLGSIIVNLLFLPIYYVQTSQYISYQFSVSYCRRCLSYGLPLVPSEIAFYLIAYSSSFFINYYVSISAVGLYSISLQLASVIGLATFGFSQVWSPFFFSHYKEPGAKEAFKKIFNYYSTALLILSAIASLFSREVLSIVTETPYHNAYQFIPLIMISLSTYYLLDYFPIGIDITKKTYHRAWIGIVTAVVNVLTNYFLIQTWGVWGAILSTLVSYLLYGTLLMIVSQRLFYVPYAWLPNLLMWVISYSTIVYASQLPLSPTTILLKISLGLILLSLPFILGVLNLTEISQVASVILSRLPRR